MVILTLSHNIYEHINTDPRAMGRRYEAETIIGKKFRPQICLKINDFHVLFEKTLIRKNELI